ncbi:HlyD family secretion protein [Microvirga brassicacearum]|uniref:HlyD family secretion protein n=1 Tax=Microvirga brassicacearum TaxID=2580413 RepID=A0A5N3PAD8_9HYPH|nr:HlyD family secretion protein [Microvirga brassicacearum]KAB0266687.1 HlyD family secretion protein [Microvirga brassicacearum]
MAYHDKDLRGRGEESLVRSHDRAPAPGAKIPEAAAPASPDVPAAKPKTGRAKRLVLLAVLAVILGVGGYEGSYWWKTGRFMVSTDDAYVQADITILSAKVSGYVASLAVGQNQSVKAGDLIATIDPGDYGLARQSAMDKLATQRSAIARIGRQIEAERASVAKAEAQIVAAQADAQQAASDFARQQQLAKSDYASKATFESAQAARDRANANVKIAQAALLAAQADVEVLAAQQVEAERVAAELQTALAKADRDLSFTEIRAPVDGIVGNKAVEVGTYVQPGTRLAAIVPLASVHVDANFKETQLAAVKPGQVVHLQVDAYPNHDIRGVIESVAPASGSVFSLLPPENATGNFTKIVQRVPVRIAVGGGVAQQNLLRPGMSVVVDVDTRTSAGDKTASVR